MSNKRKIHSDENPEKKTRKTELRERMNPCNASESAVITGGCLVLYHGKEGDAPLVAPLCGAALKPKIFWSLNGRFINVTYQRSGDVQVHMQVFEVTDSDLVKHAEFSAPRGYLCHQIRHDGKAIAYALGNWLVISDERASRRVEFPRRISDLCYLPTEPPLCVTLGTGADIEKRLGVFEPCVAGITAAVKDCCARVPGWDVNLGDLITDYLFCNERGF